MSVDGEVFNMINQGSGREMVIFSAVFSDADRSIRIVDRAPCLP